MITLVQQHDEASETEPQDENELGFTTEPLITFEPDYNEDKQENITE
jgi:hypothetical protein